MDFPIAFRELGPLNSIIQTAGRCNREGRHAEPRAVVVFRPVEIRLPPGAYALAMAKTKEFLARHPAPVAEIHRPLAMLKAKPSGNRYEFVYLTCTNFNATNLERFHRLHGHRKAANTKVLWVCCGYSFIL